MALLANTTFDFPKTLKSEISCSFLLRTIFSTSKPGMLKVWPMQEGFAARD